MSLPGLLRTDYVREIFYLQQRGKIESLRVVPKLAPLHQLLMTLGYDLRAHRTGGSRGEAPGFYSEGNVFEHPARNWLF